MAAIKSNGNLIWPDYICLINARIKIFLSGNVIFLSGNVINIDLNWLETCRGDKDQLMGSNEAGWAERRTTLGPGPRMLTARDTDATAREAHYSEQAGYRM